MMHRRGAGHISGYGSSNRLDNGFSSTSKRPRMTENMLLIAKINDYARAAGMTYGQWVSEGQQLLNKISFPDWVKPQVNGQYT